MHIKLTQAYKNFKLYESRLSSSVGETGLN